MMLALQEATLAKEAGEVPVGAVIVCGDKVVGRGRNRRETDKNALAHAELEAIAQACETLGGWRLPNCTLYVTMEPCIMCAGAILQSRIDRVVYGVQDLKFGAFGSVVDVNTLGFTTKTVAEGGVLAQESKALLQSFFGTLRTKQKEKKEGNAQ